MKIIIILGIIIVGVIIIGSLIDKDYSIENGLNQSFIDKNRITSLPSTAEILFVSNRDTGSRRMEIYSMDADGGNQKRLTFTNEHHFIMGMDSSKRYLVTSRSERDTNKPKGLGDEDRRALWLIDLETKKETRLTPIENSAEGDSFSPDGWIVFCMKIKGEEQMDLYKIKKDGTSLTQLTDTKKSIECDPAWSNDGTKIVHTYLDGMDEILYFILRKIDINGNNIEIIYDDEGSGASVPGVWAPGAYDPAWSPDDKHIVFEKIVEYDAKNPQNFGSGIGHIFKVKTDGSQEVVDLSLLGGHSDSAEYLPSYSPDGKSIVFGSIYKAEKLEESYSDIFKMDSETGEMTRLTYGDNKYPIWIK